VDALFISSLYCYLSGRVSLPAGATHVIARLYRSSVLSACTPVKEEQGLTGNLSSDVVHLRPGVANVSESTTLPLAIDLFGPFQTHLHGVALPPFRTRKAEWLLSLLTLRAGAQVERDWLAATLWPESPEASALANLRSSVRDLRQALGSEAPRVYSPTTRTLGLNLTDARADVLEFDAAVARGDPASLQQAVAIYRGPLLEGCPEEWAFQERQSREQAYLHALETLAAQALSGGHPAGAEQYLRLAISVDPFRESAYRGLMQVLAAGGNLAAAVQTFQELRLRLDRELGMAPDPQTAALFERLRDQPPPASFLQSSVGASRRRPGNLPAPPTPLLGREIELAAIEAALRGETVRLLTLTGPGGTGKTRLAIEVAIGQRDGFQDGVFLVPLAPIRDADLVASTIAHALGVQEETSRPIRELLIDHLREKQMLLLLDNFEQVVAAGLLVSELLAAAPRLKVLVTSRAALRLRGERRFPVSPLAVPEPRCLPPAALSQYAAVQLFLQRALDVKPGFALTNENAPAIAEICRRLDGLPLAIELAAARIRIFPPPALLARLGSRLELLVEGPRDLPARQQTLRDTIQWSDDLLDEPVRSIFRRLSVFVGGFTLEGAEAVGADADALAQLVDNSLLRVEEPPLSVSGTGRAPTRFGAGGDSVGREEGSRYRMLETIREFAAERLAESGEAESFALRHAAYCLHLAEQAEPELRRAEAPAWLERLEIEHDNLRAALAWCLEPHDPRATINDGPPNSKQQAPSTQHESEASYGLRLLGALAPFWTMRGHGSEGRQWVSRILALPGASDPTPARAKGLVGAAILFREEGEIATVRALYDESLILSRTCGDRIGCARVLEALGNLSREQGRLAEAETLYDESRQLYRELGDKRGMAGLLTGMALMGVEARDWQRARTLLEESRARYQELGDASGEATTLVGLCSLAANREQDLAKARRYAEAGLSLNRRLGARRGIANSLVQLAHLAVREENDAEASRLLEESLRIARELDDYWRIAHTITLLGELALRQGDLSVARARFDEALAIWRAHDSPREIAMALLHAGQAALRQGEYETAQAHHAEALTRRWDLLRRSEGTATNRQYIDQSAIAACLEGVAGVASATGQPERAARLFAAAATLRTAIDDPLPPEEQAERERQERAIRRALGEAAFAAMRAKGRGWTLEEAVRDAINGTSPPRCREDPASPPAAPAPPGPRSRPRASRPSVRG
jgi:predicted ATPase/DNA-binding SARP family transcriptional activator